MKGPYVPLSVSYRDSEKILGVDPLAELLFVRSLAFSKEKFQDGYIGNRQVLILTEDICIRCDVIPDDLFEQLLLVGLWCQVDGGFLIDGWADWNEINASRAGTLGNHKRWHVARGIVDASCAFCSAPTTVAPESGAISGATRPDIGSIAISTEQCNTHTPSPKARVDYSVDFAAWYADYPRKAGKTEALKAYAKTRKTVAADVLTDALKRWLAQWDRENRPADKIPYPASWLNKGHYLDELTVPAADDDWGKL